MPNQRQNRSSYKDLNMKKLICYSLLGLVLAFTACNNSADGKDSQMKSVIAVHDELMPKMVEITRLQEQLSATLPDSIRTPDQQRVIDDLGLAHESMMSWMRDFGDAFDFEEVTQGKLLTQAKKDSLDKYEQSVLVLQDRMLKAIKEGQETFDALKQE